MVCRFWWDRISECPWRLAHELMARISLPSSGIVAWGCGSEVWFRRRSWRRIESDPRHKSPWSSLWDNIPPYGRWFRSALVLWGSFSSPHWRRHWQVLSRYSTGRQQWWAVQSCCLANKMACKRRFLWRIPFLLVRCQKQKRPQVFCWIGRHRCHVLCPQDISSPTCFCLI